MKKLVLCAQAHTESISKGNVSLKLISIRFDWKTHTYLSIGGLRPDSDWLGFGNQIETPTICVSVLL